MDCTTVVLVVPTVGNDRCPQVVTSILSDVPNNHREIDITLYNLHTCTIAGIYRSW